MPDQIVLYDLKGQERNFCFSPNVWKARAMLNFKRLPYETEWMEFPDIAPAFKALGIPPNRTSDYTVDYTVPMIEMTDGTFVMESRNIAAALEKVQPEPSLSLDTEYPERAQSIIDKLLYALGPGMIYRVPKYFLDARGQEWYNEERKKITGGIPLVDLAGQFQWDDAEARLAELTQLLKENADGPYVMGKKVSYADFIIAGLWDLFSKVDQGDLIGRIMAFDESIPQQREACAKYFERDD